jgi:hypothetical protein
LADIFGIVKFFYEPGKTAGYSTADPFRSIRVREKDEIVAPDMPDE